LLTTYKRIRNVSALNDEQLKQEIDLVHQSSVKVCTRVLAQARLPEVDTHTLRNGTLQISTLLIQSICFLQLVNKPSLQSNPMTQSARSHTTLAITWTLTPEPKFDSKNHSKQIWILSGRDTSSQAIHLQLCRFIGQDLADLEPCFDYQKDFNEIRAHKIRIFNFVRLLVKTWQLWSLVLIIKRFQ